VRAIPILRAQRALLAAARPLKLTIRFRRQAFLRRLCL
jgi:hypothetical protein